MKETIALIILFVLGIVAFVALLLGGISLNNNYTCHRYGRLTSHEVRAAFPDACYVKTANGWFTYEQIRDVAP